MIDINICLRLFCVVIRSAAEDKLEKELASLHLAQRTNPLPLSIVPHTSKIDYHSILSPVETQYLELNSRQITVLLLPDLSRTLAIRTKIKLLFVA
jgi:hypothetical protein